MLKKNHKLLNLMILFFHFLWPNVPDSVINKVARAIFYMHQTSDVCAGLCACNCMHQMVKTARSCTQKSFCNIFPCTFLVKAIWTPRYTSVTTSNSKHDWIPIKHLNALHHNRSTLGILDMSGQFHLK